MKSIPGNVKWLLEFLNVGCKQGVFDAERVLADIDLKRPPGKKPPPREKASCTISIPGKNDKGECCDVGSYELVDYGGCLWKRTGGKVYYKGKNLDNYGSTLKKFSKEFEDYFLKNKNFGKFLGTGYTNEWYRARRALLCTIDSRGTYADDKNLRMMFGEIGHQLANINYGNPFLKKFYGAFRYYWYNQRDLHSRIKHCLYCGRFWIAEKKCRRKFCSEKCETKANAPTRYDDSMNKRLARTKKRNTDKPKIIKHLMKYYYFQGENGLWDYPNTKESKIIYNKLPKRITANYDYFIKKWAEPKGFT